MTTELAVIGSIIKTASIQGADRIHHVTVSCGSAGTWSGVCAKELGLGDKALVLLQDALLPESGRWAFMEKHKWRVRMARFKGVPSECVILPTGEDESSLADGHDLTEALGVSKYSKPIPSAIAGDIRGTFPHFIPKTDEENFQRVQGIETLMEGCNWIASLKYDGTSCTVWNDDEGMHVCSRNYELKEFTATGAGNVYWQAARKYELHRLPQGLALQFEVIGPGINGNRHKVDELLIAPFTLYDIDRRQRCHFGYLTWICAAMQIPMAAIQHAGFGWIGHDAIREIADGTTFDGLPAEGVVFRDLNSSWSFKAISLNYKD